MILPNKYVKYICLRKKTTKKKVQNVLLRNANRDWVVKKIEFESRYGTAIYRS